MQMMANKGFVADDISLSTLTATLANILTTADLPGGLQSVSWASTLVFNAAKYGGFQVTLAGATSISFSGLAAGQIIALVFVQDATGGRAVTYPSSVRNGCQPDPTPGVLSVQLFKVDATPYLDAVGPMISVNGMGGLAIGTFGAAPGNFSTLKVAGAAPNGQVLAGNGTSYVPQTAPGWSSGSNANGYWVQDPTGLIRQWGKVTNSTTGTVVTFPKAFTNPGSIVISTTSLWYGPGNSICFVIVTEGSVTITQFEVALGVGSPQDFTWLAVGY
jgi:hypothetical protein